jgi:outer membrane protein TolC
VTFRDAVDQALARNPSVKQAADAILQARALLARDTAAILPDVSASVTTTTLNTGRQFSGVTTTPRNQLTAAIGVSGLLYAPVQWALRTQAGDTVRVAEDAAADARRQVATMAAQAYLAVIGRRRVLDVQVRARDVARAHYDLARQQREAGTGSRLNEIRAEQSVSADEVLVEQAGFDLYQAQEALGVLIAADGPVDTGDEPQLEVPGTLAAAEAAMPGVRADVRLALAREQAASRVLDDSWKDWLPSVSGLFQPQLTEPNTIFQPSRSWRAQVFATATLFDSGARRAQRAERQALFNQAALGREAVLRQAHSDVRTAERAVESAERALASARAAAAQATQVVEILEIIDAQLVARNADTAAAVAEDQLRQFRLSLLLALGLFPAGQ